LDWDLLRTFKPPFVPNLVSITDTSYFSIDDVAGVPQMLTSQPIAGEATMDLYRNPNKDLAFVGYTYKRYAGFLTLDGKHFAKIFKYLRRW
jgi:protein-serine/threonine kinase